MKGCYVQNFATFCRCFEKHSTEKNKENIHVGTVYNLFDHLNMALSSGFRHLKTLLAARSVFHLFWRWQPVARAPFQQPQNAAVLKHSRPRTSDTAIRVSLIVARPYFLALLSGACHLVSCLTWCLIFRGKKSKILRDLQGQIRGKIGRFLQDFRGKKVKIHGTIGRFRGRKVKIRRKIGRFRGILAEKSQISKDFQGQILRKIGRFHGKLRGDTSPRNNQ